MRARPQTPSKPTPPAAKPPAPPAEQKKPDNAQVAKSRAAALMAGVVAMPFDDSASEKQWDGGYTQEMTDEFTAAQFEPSDVIEQAEEQAAGVVGAAEPGDAVAKKGLPTPPSKFKSQIEVPELPEKWGRIVDSVFEEEDPEVSFDEVKRGLRMAGRASAADYGSLADALDAAEDLARKAHLLYVRAQDEYDGFEKDTDIVLAALRDEASDVLEGQKKDKTRTKQITDADVLSEIAARFPDEWQELSKNRRQAKLMVSHLEDLHRRAVARAVHLRTMLKGRSGME